MEKVTVAQINKLNNWIDYQYMDKTINMHSPDFDEYKDYVLYELEYERDYVMIAKIETKGDSLLRDCGYIKPSINDETELLYTNYDNNLSITLDLNRKSLYTLIEFNFSAKLIHAISYKMKELGW